MARRKLILLTALELEARALEQAVASLADPALLPIELHTIGLRAVRIPLTLNAETPETVRAVILAGLAGGLDPSLGIGDLVIDSWPPEACPGLPMRYGAIHTAEGIVATVAEKSALWRRTGALAVDMETDFVRRAAVARGLPFVCLRAISDTAHEALDPAVARIVDPFGRPRAAALTGAVLRRPALFATLWRLGKSSKLATRALAVGIRQVIEVLSAEL